MAAVTQVYECFTSKGRIGEKIRKSRKIKTWQQKLEQRGSPSRGQKKH